jgi:hypothetical protein
MKKRVHIFDFTNCSCIPFFGIYLINYFSVKPGPEHDFGENIAPFGSELEGDERVWIEDNIVKFNFNDSVEYWINLSCEKTQRGIIGVYEKYSDFYPVLDAGTRYRNSEGHISNPEDFPGDRKTRR